LAKLKVKIFFNTFYLIARLTKMGFIYLKYKQLNGIKNFHSEIGPAKITSRKTCFPYL